MGIGPAVVVRCIQCDLPPAAQGKDDFFKFGEVYDADPALLAPYVRDTDMNSVLDFAFQSSAVSFAKGGSATKTLQTMFAGDDRYTTPDSSATARKSAGSSRPRSGWRQRSSAS